MEPAVIRRTTTEDVAFAVRRIDPAPRITGLVEIGGHLGDDQVLVRYHRVHLVERFRLGVLCPISVFIMFPWPDSASCEPY